MQFTRPLVSVYKVDAKARDKGLKGESAVSSTEQVAMPAVFQSPIRPDIVSQVHALVMRNTRQPHAVSPKAGHQTSAESWGTGRAVARIPRVAGGGTHRAGQGAFGNMCRGGRMSGPTNILRKIHCKVPKGQRRYATVSALAATAIPALVMARGHRIDNVPELPLVVDDECQAYTRTRQAMCLLTRLKAHKDIVRVKKSRRIRAGRGKMRNRRRVQATGPLIVYEKDEGLVRAFRNIPGVNTCSVYKLGVLQLAPGGHLGRFVIFTKSAMETMNRVFGTFRVESELKGGFSLPYNVMSNPDIERILTSDEVKSVLKRPRRARRPLPSRPKWKNPFNRALNMRKLDPLAAALMDRNIRKRVLRRE